MKSIIQCPSLEILWADQEHIIPMQSSKGMTFSLLLQMENSLHFKGRKEKTQVRLFLNIFVLQFRFSSSFENLLFLHCQTSQTNYSGYKMV